VTTDPSDEEYGRSLVDAGPPDDGDPYDAAIVMLDQAREDLARRRDADHRDRPEFGVRVLSRDQLRSLPEPEPLIEGVLDRRTTALLSGYWGSYKSFIALDLMLCVATGKSWQGRKVHHAGPVLYVAAEGAYGLDSRVHAWETAWGHKADQIEVYPDPVNLLHRDQVDALVGYVTERQHVMVTLDTIARCMVGGEENSAKDMGLVVDALDRIKRATDGGVALGVAHAGITDRGRTRGSSALEAGVDTVYITERLGQRGVDLHREKRKDGPREDQHQLQLREVAQSCILEIAPPNLGAEEGPNADRCYQLLLTRFDELGASRKDLEEVTKLPQSSVTYALNVLLKESPPRIRREGKGHATRYWPVIP
jgi:hypothetical protein